MGSVRWICSGRFGAKLETAAGFAAAGALAFGLAPEPARAEVPIDLASAFARAFEGVEACVALRDVQPGAEIAVSDPAACRSRAPACGPLDLPITIVALDRGVVPDVGTPVKRDPPEAGDPPDGISPRDAFRNDDPWVFETLSDRIGAESLDRALAAMRYGDAERPDHAGERRYPEISPREQVEFLAKLKRGELPTSSESQARTVEIVPSERIGEVRIATLRSVCAGVAWAVGWIDRPQRASVAFATLARGRGLSAQEIADRTRALLSDLGLTPRAN